VFVIGTSRSTAVGRYCGIATTARRAAALASLPIEHKDTMGLANRRNPTDLPNQHQAALFNGHNGV
jgi:hypothetical protein